MRPRDPDQRVAQRRRAAALRQTRSRRAPLYGFRNLNAKQSRHQRAPGQGPVGTTWRSARSASSSPCSSTARSSTSSTNAVPKIISPTAALDDGAAVRRATSACRRTAATTASPTGDPGQGPPRESDRPVNVEAPHSGRQPDARRAPADLRRRVGERRRPTDFWVTWYRSNPVGASHPRYRAPSQIDLGDFTTPPEKEA